MSLFAHTLSHMLITDEGTCIHHTLTSDNGRTIRERLGATSFQVLSGSGFDLWIDEEGALTGREIDQTASAVVYTLTRRAHLIHGPVLVTRSRSGDQDDTQSLTDADVEHLHAIVKAFWKDAGHTDDD